MLFTLRKNLTIHYIQVRLINSVTFFQGILKTFLKRIYSGFTIRWEQICIASYLVVS